MLVLKKVKQLLSNFEAERWENLSNLRLAKKSVAYKKTLVYWAHLVDVCDGHAHGTEHIVEEG